MSDVGTHYFKLIKRLKMSIKLHIRHFLVRMFYLLFPSKICFFVLPCRVKRMIFWAAVVGHFQNTIKDPNFLKKINTALKLSKDITALELPAILHPTVWNQPMIDDTLKEYLLNKDIKFKNAFIVGIPEWLRYASAAKIERDLDRFTKVDLLTA